MDADGLRIFGYTVTLDPVNWSGISGIANVFMVLINIFLLITVFQGLRSIKEAKKTRDADMMTLVLEQIEPIKPDMARLRRLGSYQEERKKREKEVRYDYRCLLGQHGRCRYSPTPRSGHHVNDDAFFIVRGEKGSNRNGTPRVAESWA